MGKTAHKHAQSCWAVWVREKPSRAWGELAGLPSPVLQLMLVEDKCLSPQCFSPDATESRFFKYSCHIVGYKMAFSEMIFSLWSLTVNHNYCSPPIKHTFSSISLIETITSIDGGGSSEYHYMVSIAKFVTTPYFKTEPMAIVQYRILPWEFNN